MVSPQDCLLTSRAHSPRTVSSIMVTNRNSHKKLNYNRYGVEPCGSLKWISEYGQWNETPGIHLQHSRQLHVHQYWQSQNRLSVPTLLWSLDLQDSRTKFLCKNCGHGCKWILFPTDSAWILQWK